ncbi:MAG: gluconate 2-dehydrogenase subunit 3 family protein [Armatimonadetes bacterium]|nr:gluconate 2-dehydrogenase subunit 3 family protein [Akkermansiaceae bacterium]
MDRRELLKIMAMTLGGSVALPESVFAKIGEPFDPTELTFFTPLQREQVAALAEAIIPKTETPGAIEAGVPGWIEVILKDCYLPEDQKIITAGLADLAKRCQDRHGKSIDKLTPAEQVTFLTEADQEARSGKLKAEQEGQLQRETFLQQFKELAKFTYVNSEIGATQAFEFHMTPGKWVASMPLEPGQKAYSY